MSAHDPFDGKYDDAPSGESRAQREESVEAPEPAIEVSVYPRGQLVRMQKAELQDLARQRGLSTSGTREELIERVETAQGAGA
jgi:hypothetical protein